MNSDSNTMVFSTFMVTSGFASTHVEVPGHCNKNFATRIFYISDANQRQNQVPLGCTTIYAIFLLMVRRIGMSFSLKPSLSQGKSFLNISANQV